MCRNRIIKQLFIIRKKMENCSKEKEINEIWKKIERVEQAIWKGNGKKSIQETIINIEAKVDQQTIINDNLNNQLNRLNDNTEKIGTVLSGILRFQDETKGQMKAQLKYASNMRWLIVLFATIVLTLSGWIITLKV